VLANYGLDNLRFLKPITPGTAIEVALTVKSKKMRAPGEYGEVSWAVTVTDEDGDVAATYDLLTMNAV
jgi:oxepin-CoA hydrolase/3-oxo-5,6-dehydrosuberyl-CoA semialdehyde dehydrogenase